MDAAHAIPYLVYAALMIPPRVRLAILLLLTAYAWLEVRHACFFLDDERLALSNRIVARSDIWSAFFLHLWSGANQDGGAQYHRPLVLLTFMFDHNQFGGNGRGWHLHSLAWHLGAMTTVYALAARRIGPSRALVATAIFGLHPIQSEAVTWIAARNDLMAAVGVLGALAALDRGRLALASLAALLAVGSKELGYLLPGLWVCWRLAWGERPRVAEGVALALPLAVMGGIRLAAGLADAEFTHSGALSTVEVLGRATLMSLSWLTMPWPLTSQASVHVEPGALRWGGALLSVVGLVALARRAGPRRWLLVAALGSWAPTLLVTWEIGHMGERFLYLPLAFLVLVLAEQVPLTRPAGLVGVALGLVSTTIIAFRLVEWSTPTWLIEAADAHQPSPLTRHHMGRLHEADGKRRRAIEAYRDALRGRVPMLPACGESARLLMDRQDLDAAAGDLEEQAPLCSGRPGYEAQRARLESLRAAELPAAPSSAPEVEPEQGQPGPDAAEGAQIAPVEGLAEDPDGGEELPGR